MKQRGGFGSRKGFALLVVIVIMLLVSFLASQLILQVRTETKIAINEKERAVSRFLAEAGINLDLFRMIDTPIEVIGEEETEKFHEGQVYEQFLEKGRVQYFAVNESGKIDLNRSHRRLLELFLEYYKLQPDEIATIVDSWLDWRDSDDLHRLNGAERDVYEALDDPYVPRNGTIQDPAEFFLIHGTEPLRGKFLPAEVFTVYNSQRTINVNSLTPAMLDFLTEGDEAKKAAYREARTEYGNLNAALARQILGDERYGVLKPYLTYGSGNIRYYFLVGTGQSGYTQEEAEREKEEGQGAAHHVGVKVMALIQKSGARSKYLSWEVHNI